jgi:hypothetical protein
VLQVSEWARQEAAENLQRCSEEVADLQAQLAALADSASREAASGAAAAISKADLALLKCLADHPNHDWYVEGLQQFSQLWSCCGHFHALFAANREAGHDDDDHEAAHTRGPSSCRGDDGDVQIWINASSGYSEGVLTASESLLFHVNQVGLRILDCPSRFAFLWEPRPPQALP